jgi:hypothetical protein
MPAALFSFALSRIPSTKNKIHHLCAEMRHDSDHPYPREAAVHKRSGVGRRPVVQAVQPRRAQALQSASSATLHKDRTWPTTKQHLRHGGNPVASALYHGRAICSLSSKWSGRLVMARECNRAALGAAILSGFPTITTPSFSQCPISGPVPFVGATKFSAVTNSQVTDISKERRTS